jgi:hypothetical protein
MSDGERGRYADDVVNFFVAAHLVIGRIPPS